MKDGTEGTESHPQHLNPNPSQPDPHIQSVCRIEMTGAVNRVKDGAEKVERKRKRISTPKLKHTCIRSVSKKKKKD